MDRPLGNRYTRAMRRRIVSSLPRFRLSRRRASLAALIFLAGLAVLLDRLGAFGRPGDDLEQYNNRTFRVARVVDGDTLDLDIPDGRHEHTRVRLWGVDTPEVYKDDRSADPDYYGPEASAFAKAIADGQQVRIELIPGHTRDRTSQHRLLAYVWLPDGTMLNERLLEEGCAYADLRFDHPRFVRFKGIEARARRSRAGLWAEVQPDQWPAWRQRMLRDKAASRPDG
ncbi:MAG: hypothetical protein BIFFINMI_03349 [Phycisphaerae bacterium]|nr:hypothetical protein [Phycisphaerae bacterium]